MRNKKPPCTKYLFSDPSLEDSEPVPPETNLWGGQGLGHEARDGGMGGYIPPPTAFQLSSPPPLPPGTLPTIPQSMVPSHGSTEDSTSLGSDSYETAPSSLASDTDVCKICHCGGEVGHLFKGPGYFGLFITLVPKVLQLQILIRWVDNFWNCY